MISIKIALIVFTCVFCGALLGMILRAITPGHHLSQDSKDVIKLGTGLVATIAALVLGLVISTAKGSFDVQDAAVKQTSAKILMLDRVLAQYGPETKETRDLLRRIVAYKLDQIWPEDRSQTANLGEHEAVPAGEEIQARIMRLTPQNDGQRWLQSRALQISGDIMETRWLVLAGEGGSIQVPFLVVIVFWLTIIFVSFGLFAPRNAVVVAVLFVCALSVAAAIFLLVEMDQPFQGLMKISSAPLRFTLSHLGK
jgi:hypothetical protein